MPKKAATKAAKTKEARIKDEVDTLQELCKNVPDDRLDLAMRLVEQAAWTKVTIEDLQADIDLNGHTQIVRSSNSLPEYERPRPEVKQLQTYQSQYLRTIEGIKGLLPKVKPAEDEEAEVDDFDRFLNEDDEMDPEYLAQQAKKMKEAYADEAEMRRKSREEAKKKFPDLYGSDD